MLISMIKYQIKSFLYILSVMGLFLDAFISRVCNIIVGSISITYSVLLKRIIAYCVINFKVNIVSKNAEKINVVEALLVIS